ncbi:MAG: hypothetical protein VKL39_21855, partial [Leptolyngbyaceae bacterium]|nr:hypothetical protein [Leptolyngbyaceae bacterium]
PLLNVGTGEDITIRELAETISKVIGFEGDLRFDASKPDGTPRKLIDSTRITDFGWSPQSLFQANIQIAYRDFVNRLRKYLHS